MDGQKNWKSFHRPVKKPRGNVENPVERVESLFFNKETLFCTSGRGIILVVPVEANKWTPTERMLTYEVY